MADWANFFVAEAGAAAALAGLLFVSVSINLTRILQLPTLPPRAAEALMLLLAVLILSLLALVPGQSPAVLGAEVSVLGVLLWIVLTLALARGGRPRQQVLMRLLINQLPPVMFVVAGVMLYSGHPAGLYWLVPATLLAIAAGVLGAWVLLIEILR
jgi:modulator of FtsH protease